MHIMSHITRHMCYFHHHSFSANAIHICLTTFIIILTILLERRSQWSRDLRRRSAAARLLRSWVQIPPGGMDVCCECCVLLGRGLCDELVTRSGESFRMCCVVVCDLETSRMRRPWPALGHSARAKKKKIYIYIYVCVCVLCIDSS